MERTVLAEDVQSILKQNDKILDLNREIFELIKSYRSPHIDEDFKDSDKSFVPGNVIRKV